MENPSTKTALVHKEGEEGAIQIDARTGNILTPVDERPDWAEGLAVALLAERHKWYGQRLGKAYANAHADPEAFAFEDLGWIGVDAEGDEVELEASDDWRMNVLAEVVGIDRDSGEDIAKAGLRTLAEAEIANDTTRTDPEAAEIAEAFAEDAFGGKSETEARRTGT